MPSFLEAEKMYGSPNAIAFLTNVDDFIPIHRYQYEWLADVETGEVGIIGTLDNVKKRLIHV